MIIKRLNPDDAAEVASLHSSCLKSGFLSSLGQPFLKRLYESMIDSENAFCLVARSETQIVGFISGASSTSRFYAEFFRRNAFRGTAVIVRKLFQKGVLMRIIETLRYPSVRLPNVPSAELLSIAVREGFRNGGIGKLLFFGLVNEFKEREIRRFRIVVGNELAAANHFYRQMGARCVAQTEVHKKFLSNVYVWGS
jgi:ribosomal protein S18 acetylase RimI-like enzyme